MKDFKLDDNWDLDKSSNDLLVIEGSEEVGQNVGIKIRTIRGEYVFNPELGVPWQDGMFGSGFLDVERDYELRKAILSTKGVDKINTFTFRIDSSLKLALVNYSFVDEFGTTTGTVDDEVTI